MRVVAEYINTDCNLSNHFTGRMGEYAYCTRHGSFVKTCNQCKKQFHTRRYHTATCSNACRMAASRANKSTQEKV